MTAVALVLAAFGFALLWGAIVDKNPLTEIRAALVGSKPLTKAA